MEWKEESPGISTCKFYGWKIFRTRGKEVNTWKSGGTVQVFEYSFRAVNQTPGQYEVLTSTTESRIVGKILEKQQTTLF